MKRVLVSPAHYLVDYTSRSEFYFAGKLLKELGEQMPEIEFYVVCGRCPVPMPCNVRVYEVMKGKGDLVLNLWSRIGFYCKTTWLSLRLSWKHDFDVVWHLFPNGRFSFHPYLFFQLDRLFFCKPRRLIGRLQYAKHDIHHSLDGMNLGASGMYTVQTRGPAELLQSLLLRMLGRFSTYYFNLFDQLVFNNRAAVDHYLSVNVRTLRGEINIIPVGVDLSRFRFSQKIWGSPLRLLYAGVLDRNKRVIELVQLCRELARNGTEFKLKIVGNGELKQELVDLVQEYALDPHIEFLGNVPKDRMMDLYEQAHILFSLSKSESFGQVFAESWSTGTMFIGSRIPVYEEVVRHGQNAYLVDVETEEGIERAAALVSRLTESDYIRVTEAARTDVTKYDWQSVAYAYAILIRRLV